MRGKISPGKTTRPGGNGPDMLRRRATATADDSGSAGIPMLGLSRKARAGRHALPVMAFRLIGFAGVRIDHHRLIGRSANCLNQRQDMAGSRAV